MLDRVAVGAVVLTVTVLLLPVLPAASVIFRVTLWVPLDRALVTSALHV